MKAKFFILVIVSIILSTATFAQSVKTLEYNVGLGTFTGLLPFDQPFNLKLINITNTPDSISVRLIEVPKKNYHKISKSKKNNRQNWRVITAEDVYNYNPDNSFISMLDTVIAVQSPTDTFYSLAVPFYLKPESKYLIDIKSFVRRDLTDAEQTTLVVFIKNNGLYKSTLNEIIIPNILNPDVTSIDWGINTTRLQDIVQQVIQAKHRNYVIGEIDYEEQLLGLSDFLDNLNGINDEFFYLNSLLSKSKNPLAPAALPAVRQRHNNLLHRLTRIDWMRIKRNDNDYRSFINLLQTALNADSSIIDSAKGHYITKAKTAITKFLDDAIAAKETFNNGFINFIAANVNTQSVIASTNSESMVEQAKLHVTFDLGYAYVGQMDRGNAYAGLNIYFRSIDTSLPLKNYRLKFWDFVGSRTSLLIGASIQSIQKDSVRKGLLSNEMALVTGIGFRLLPWFKINGGAYMYYLYSRNPLRTKNDYSFKASPFISLSIDFNLSSFLGTFGNGNLFNNIFKQ